MLKNIEKYHIIIIIIKVLRMKFGKTSQFSSEHCIELSNLLSFTDQSSTFKTTRPKTKTNYITPTYAHGLIEINCTISSPNEESLFTNNRNVTFVD